MKTPAQRLRTLGFTVLSCRLNDSFVGYRVLSSSGGVIHPEYVVSEAWIVSLLGAIDTGDKSP